MKPHRRKKTPPRRENGKEEHAHPTEASQAAGAGPVSEETPPPVSPDPATYEAPEQPYVDPGEMAYDPSQALAEEPASPYAELDSPQDYSAPPSQDSETSYDAYREPPAEPLANPGQQAYVDPNQAYVDPNQQAYVDPNQQAYVDPNQQAYVDPNQQAYVEPPPAPPAPPEPAADAGIYDEVPSAHERKTKPRRKLAKKKGPVPPPAGGPAARPTGRPPLSPGKPGAYSKPLSSSGGGISVMTVFLSLSALVMLAIVVAVVVPKDLRHVSGYPASSAVVGESRNLLEEGQKIMISRKGELSLTEEEVNRYLNDRLKGRQSGVMGILVRFEGVYIDFTPGFAEIIVQRRFIGIPITMTAKIKGENFRRQVLYKPAGWSIGKIKFKSRNIKPVIEMFHRLRETMEDEYQVIQLMANVRFEQDRIVLDPSRGD